MNKYLLHFNDDSTEFQVNIKNLMTSMTYIVVFIYNSIDSDSMHIRIGMGEKIRTGYFFFQFILVSQVIRER